MLCSEAVEDLDIDTNQPNKDAIKILKKKKSPEVVTTLMLFKGGHESNRSTIPQPLHVHICFRGRDGGLTAGVREGLLKPQRKEP